MLVDTFEPSLIYEGIVAQLPQSTRFSLNNLGRADYFWWSVDNRTIQFERKTWGEILGGTDKVEEQLTREYTQADETNLLVEGVALPSAVGVETYKPKPCKLHSGPKPSCFVCKGKPVVAHSYSYGSPNKPQYGLWDKITSWLWQLDKAGIGVYYSPSDMYTARTLVSIFNNSQKSEHTTLRRYIRPKLQINNRDPYAMTLMGLVNPDTGRTFIGEKTARKLLDSVGGKPYYVFNEDPQELLNADGIGVEILRKVWASIGRDE
jgi:hypothetical protein